MKKAIYISAFIVLCQISVLAQKTKVGFSGGVGGGVAISNFITDGAAKNPSSNAGLTMGIMWNVPFKKSFSFQPQINYVRKGNHQDLYSGYEDRLTINYFETQFNFLYHTPGENGHFFIGLGPSAALAINGKETLTKASKEEVSIVKFGNHETDDMKKYDFGATALAGYQFAKVVSISVCYNQGITNLHPVYGDYITVRSHYIGAKLGFLF